MITSEGGGQGEGGGSSGSSSCGVGGGEGGGGRGDGGATLKKGPWTAWEDAILTEYVNKHGEGNWKAVQKNSGLARCGKSCRLRWANHLRPNLKKGSFSLEEERIIVELHAKLGNKWARMAALLPGRTDNEIKNYWNTRVKRRQRQCLPLYPSDIQPQPQPQSQSYQSQPTTPMSSSPATPTSSFSFHTPTQLPSPTSTSSLAPTPTSHSPLSSPHHHTFPTLPLFDLSNTNPFSLHRNPPTLQTPIRFRRFHHEINDINNVNRSSDSLSIPSSPMLQSSTHLPQSHSLPQLSRFPSFSLSPVSFNHDSPHMMQTQFGSNQMVSPGLVYAVKQELPSNQYLSQIGNSDITFETRLNNSNWGVPTGGSGLLEDLLEEAQALASSDDENLRRRRCFGLQEEKRGLNGFDQWGDSSCMNFSSAAVLKPKEEAADQINIIHDDLTKRLNVIPSAMQTAEWYHDSGEISNGQSSGITDATTTSNVGIEIQHIASLFPAATTTNHGRIPDSSCSWDNMPGIC